MKRNRVLGIAVGALVGVSVATSVGIATLTADASEIEMENQVFVGGQLVGENGDVKLVLQTDGNLVLYKGAAPQAASNTAGTANLTLTVQADGNVVLTSNGTVVKHSGTFGHPGASLAVQPDGNVVVYAPDNTPIAALFGTVTPLGLLAPISKPAPAAAPQSLGAQAVEIALQYQGRPYISGGASPAGFDCSGLVVMVYGQLGVPLPHNSTAIRNSPHTTVVPREAAQPGDIVWVFGHVAIYLGGDEQMEAHGPGRLAGVTRIWENNPTFLRVG